MAGKKVSQLQAVLARRCAVIGELQQHLWRANWRKGVAEWGMLGGGVGGEWASVVRVDPVFSLFFVVCAKYNGLLSSSAFLHLENI